MTIPNINFIFSLFLIINFFILSFLNIITIIGILFNVFLFNPLKIFPQDDYGLEFILLLPYLISFFIITYFFILLFTIASRIYLNYVHDKFKYWNYFDNFFLIL
jgi:hypothetical protein